MPIFARPLFVRLPLSRFFVRTSARFAASCSGNVAIIFAIACIPVIAAMGLAVDYTRAAQTTSAMQDALDAASLALSRQTNLSTMTTRRSRSSPRTTSPPTSITTRSRTSP